MNDEDFAGSDNSAINSNDDSDVEEEDVHNISDRVSVIADMCGKTYLRVPIFISTPPKCLNPR